MATPILGLSEDDTGEASSCVQVATLLVSFPRSEVLGEVGAQVAVMVWSCALCSVGGDCSVGCVLGGSEAEGQQQHHGHTACLPLLRAREPNLLFGLRECGR